MAALTTLLYYLYFAGAVSTRAHASAAPRTLREHDLIRRLVKFVKGVASGQGSVVGDRAADCSTPHPPPPGARYSVVRARTDSKGRLSRRPSGPGYVLCPRERAV
jgi:hypothetical protein